MTEVRYAALFEHVSSGIAIYNGVEDGSDFVFLDFNPAAERMDGICRADLVGRRVTEVFPGVADFGLLDVLRRVWRTGQTEHYPVALYRDARISGWRENEVFKLPGGEVVAIYDDRNREVEVEARFRSTFEQAAVGMAHIGLDGRFLRINDKLCQITGYPRQEIEALTFQDITHPDDLEADLKLAARLWAGSMPHYQMEKRYRHRDGSYVWVGLTASVVRDTMGQPSYGVAVIEDISTKKEAEALRADEELQRMALNAASAGAWRYDLKTGRQVWTAENYRIFGLARGETPGDYEDWLAKCVDPRDQVLFDYAWREAIAARRQEFRIDFRSLHPEKGVRWLALLGRLVCQNGSTPAFAYGISLDISVQREMEQKLRDSEERQSFLLGLSDALRPLANPDEIKGEALRMLSDHLGVSRALYGEIVDETWADVRVEVVQGMPSLAGRYRIEDFGATQVEAFRRGETLVVNDIEADTRFSALEKQQTIALDVRAWLAVGLVKDGHWVATLGVNSPMRHDWTETDVQLVRETADRTWSAVERARAEQLLRENEERLRQAMEAANAGSWELDVKTGLLVASERALEFCGLPGGVPLHVERALLCVHPEDRTKVETALRATVETGEPLKCDMRVLPPDGSVRWLNCCAERRIQGEQTFLIGLVQDISNRKRDEEHIRLLMREVDHRAKNMLTVILAIARQTASSSPLDFLTRFESRIQSLAAAQGLLVQNKWTAIPLMDLIYSQLGHFSELIGRRIAVEGPPIALKAEAAQAIGMALHELATNAAKHGALSNESGRITLNWRIVVENGGKSFEMCWVETCGPPVREPARRGFGSSVISSMVQCSLGGSALIEYAPKGITWRLICNVGRVQEGAYSLAC